MSRRPAPTKRLAEKWRRPSVSDDITICDICNRELVEPRTLPCMHSFCEECLFVLLRCYESQKKLDRTFLCPTCNVRTPCHILGKVTFDWLRMFPRKQDIDKMKEAILVVEEMCHTCSMSWKVTPATKFCVDCQEYMCSGCDAEHAANSQCKSHKVVDYEVKQMKNTPVANISKFQCKTHKSLRYSSYCEVHQVYLCNTCREGAAHRQCRITHRVIEATGNITRAETVLNVINSLKRDERGQGKQLLKLIEQIDLIQERLNECRKKQVDAYCNYVMQASITEQKTEAIDALKGKLEFVKTYQSHETINNTMNKVEDILMGYTSMFADAGNTEEKAARLELNKQIGEIEKIVNKPVFDKGGSKQPSDIQASNLKRAATNNTVVKIPIAPKEPVTTTEKFLEEEPMHVCKKHVDDTLDEETFYKLGNVLQSVGAICYKNMCATAFRVGSTYVMTAAHTVRDIVDPERKGRPEWSSLEDPGVYLTFASPYSAPNATKHILSQQVTFLDDELNVAILEIMTDEPLPPPIVLSKKDIEAAKVTKVALIGYGHKGSQSKHLDIKCEVVKPESERATKALKWLKNEERRYRCNLLVKNVDATGIRWHYNEMKSLYNITIDCCMEYRALGAPVITDTGPNGAAECLAIVTRSIPDCYADLPKKTQERCVEYRFETATKMSDLYERLFLETRFVADDIFVKDKSYFGLETYGTYTMDSETRTFASSTPRSSELTTPRSSEMVTPASDVTSIL